jgi:MBG domain-containing protein
MRNIRTKLRSKFTLLFMMLGMLLAIPAVALADNIQDNVADNVTSALQLTAGDANSKPTAEVKVIGNNAQQDPDSGCNFDVTTESLTIKFNTPTGVTATALDGATATPGEMKFTACGVDQTVQLSASSSAAAGNYTVTANIVNNSSGGTFTNQVSIPITVSPPPDSTPPVITKDVAGTLGNNGWYTTNVGVDWTVSDPQSAISSQSGCADFSVTSDQDATTYTCTATSVGGTSSDSVTIKRDATQPTNVQFVGGPSANGSYTFGNVPNESTTCTATDATSTVDTCVVSGYSNAVGTHTLTATATDKAGNKSTATRTYTVNKADPTISWDAPAAIDYGTALNATQLNATANVAGTFDYTPEAGSMLNAGTHTLSVQFTPNDTTNYNSASKTVSLTVNKVDATINVDGFSGPYDGNAHGATGSATGVSNENLSNLLNLGASFTNVPGGTADWTFEGNTNYNSASGSVAIVINKADTKTTVSCDAGPFTYTGSAHTPCSASVTGPGGLNQSLMVTYTNNTNAGTATASASYAGTTNYGASSDSTTFTIDKATAQVTLSDLGPYFYDGTPKAATATTSNPAGLNVTITYNGSTTAPTKVGSYNVVATVDNPNYQGQATGTLVIKPWTLNGFYQPIDMGDVLNTVKNGSTVPVKFELFSGTTELTSTSAVTSILARPMNCSALAGDPEDPIETLATGGTSLRYDATAGQFIYNWTTPKGASQVGKCYSLTMTAADNSTITAYFKLK